MLRKWIILLCVASWAVPIVYCAHQLAGQAAEPPPDNSALAAWRAMLDAYVPPETYGMAPHVRPWPALLWGWQWREVPPYPYPWMPYTPWLPGDLTFSGAIGEADLLWFRNCQTGPEIAYPQMLAGIPIRCDLCDLDEDSDVDQDDFGLLQARMGEAAEARAPPDPPDDPPDDPIDPPDQEIPFVGYTEKYVTVTGAGAHDGSSEANAWTFAEMIAAAPAAGTRVNIKAGSYSEGVTTLPSGTALDPVCLRGYNSTPGDLDGQRRNADGSFNDTGLPDFTITGLWTPGLWSILQNLDCTGALSSPLVGSISTDFVFCINCRFVNTQNHANARAIQGDNSYQLVNCDFACTGEAHAAVVDTDLELYVLGCRFQGVSSSPLLQYEQARSAVEESIFIGSSSSVGLQINGGTAAANSRIRACTFYGLDTCITFPDAESPLIPWIINCHATDCAKWIDNLYSATDEAVCLELFNRTRDITTPRTGVFQGVLGGEITTDTGGAETDYVNAAAGDLRLIPGAPGAGTGVIPYSDCGALQRAEPTLPSDEEIAEAVWTRGERTLTD